MKIALLGYGKMGKAIEEIAIERGHQIVLKIDADNLHDLEKIHEADAAIEFTQPESVVSNLKACINKGVPVVCGTTGWLQERNAVEAYCREKAGTFFYASNFSLGVNLFFKLNEVLARMMNNYPAYEVEIDEIHHTQKKDAPSGTAITLAEGIIHSIDRKTQWVNAKDMDPKSLVIRSFREDPAPGTHKVKYMSEVDDIEIRHTAHSRKGFALGAVLVAEWIIGRKGVLGMGDFLKL